MRLKAMCGENSTHGLAGEVSSGNTGIDSNRSGSNPADLPDSGDGDIPLFLRIADGNENDKKVFGQIVKDYKSRVSFETIIVSDSALYSRQNLKLMEGIEWISRVPLSIKEAKKLVNNLSADEFTQSQISGYSWREKLSQYGKIEQRWLIVESQQRKASDLEKLEKKIKLEKESASQKLAL